MDGLIAAYREGLALAAVAVITGSGSVRIAALKEDRELQPDESVVARWWCRRAAEAECVADSAGRSFVRLRDRASGESSLACDAVIRTARQLAVSMQSDADLEQEAMRALARLDEEIERQQQAGALKSVNQSYRQYRLETSARGERVLPYAKWMERYKVKLIREIAVNLRRL